MMCFACTPVLAAEETQDSSSGEKTITLDVQTVPYGDITDDYTIHYDIVALDHAPEPITHELETVDEEVKPFTLGVPIHPGVYEYKITPTLMTKSFHWIDGDPKIVRIVENEFGEIGVKVYDSNNSRSISRLIWSVEEDKKGQTPTNPSVKPTPNTPNTPSGTTSKPKPTPVVPNTPSSTPSHTSSNTPSETPSANTSANSRLSFWLGTAGISVLTAALVLAFKRHSSSGLD